MSKVGRVALLRAFPPLFITLPRLGLTTPGRSKVVPGVQISHT